LVSGIFDQNNLLGKALQVTSLRNDVINTNIANADTPGYKRKTVSFEDMFQQAVYAKNASAADIAKLTPTVQVADPGFSGRLDENNVDIEQEMTEMYKNALRNDVLVGGITSNQKRLALVYEIK